MLVQTCARSRGCRSGARATEEVMVMTATAIPETAAPKRDAYETLLERCREIEPITTAVAYPCEATTLAGVVEAAEAGLIVPILVGPRVKIQEVAVKAGLKIDGYPIEDVAEPKAAAAKAVELVRAAKAEVLMKGSLHTDELLAAVVPSAT